jgi:hypothetical protein
LKRPKIAWPVASLPSSALRTAWVRLLSSAVALIPSATLPDGDAVESEPPSPPPTSRTTTRITTTRAPAPSPISAPRSFGIFRLGIWVRLAAGIVAAGASTFCAAGSAEAGSDFSGAAGGPAGASGTEAAGSAGRSVTPGSSTSASASLTRSRTSSTLMPIRAAMSS